MRVRDDFVLSAQDDRQAAMYTSFSMCAFRIMMTISPLYICYGLAENSSVRDFLLTTVAIQLLAVGMSVFGKVRYEH
jgi:hypothetical protein